MKKHTQLLAVLTAAAVGSSLLSVTVAAAPQDDQPQVRLVIENTTLTGDEGADWTGTLVDEWVDIDEDSTAAGIFLTVLERHQYTQQGADVDYITEINGLSAEDGGTMGGWMICLDDWITDEGLSAYTVRSGKLEDGDTLTFRYSCSWGADLGYDWSGNDTSLSAVSFSVGELSPELSADTFDYVLTLPEGTETVTVQPTVGNKAYRAKIYKNVYTPAEKGTDYKSGQPIEVTDGDTLVIGVANAAWMQNNYNQAVESVYRFQVNEALAPIDTQVQAAESLIAAIGTVTPDSRSAIETARRYVDALSAEQQGQVSNLSALVQAEAAYAALMEDTALLPVEELRQRYTQTLQDSPVYGNEWDIINLCRFGLAEDDIREHYCDSVRQALEETGSAVFSRTRSTVNAGVVTALTACGVDAADFYGYDLTAPLCEAEYVQKQGLNGVVYALLALDTHDYAADTAIRETFLSVILNAQEPDGGWTIDTWSGVEDGSDADMTAMVLQALAPYAATHETVQTAVNKALTFLSDNMNDKGQLRSYGYYDCESGAQTLIALCALGIDPTADERFMVNDRTVYAGLLSFFHEDSSGFSHFEDSESNYLSTYQGYAAAAAYDRFCSGLTAYFDMSDVTLTVMREETSQPQEDSTVPSSRPAVVSEPSQTASSVPMIDQPSDTVRTGASSPLYVLCGVLLSSAVLVLLFRKKRTAA